MDNSIKDIEKLIFRAAGGRSNFLQELPFLIRQAIDELIDAPRTRRLKLDELEANEKAVLGIKIEATLRYLLDFPRGILDFKIGDHDVDVKFTMRDNWMIPPEALGHTCLVCRVSERDARFWIGLVRTVPENLTNSPNRDGKVSISAQGKKSIHWIAENQPFPANIWEDISQSEAAEIFQPNGGTERLVLLLKKFLGKPIHRSTIHSVARQHDYMKRLRLNQGARDYLHPQGIVILSGSQDGPLLKKLNIDLGSDFILAYRPKNEHELNLIQSKKRHAEKFCFMPHPK